MIKNKIYQLNITLPKEEIFKKIKENSIINQKNTFLNRFDTEKPFLLLEETENQITLLRTSISKNSLRPTLKINQNPEGYFQANFLINDLAKILTFLIGGFSILMALLFLVFILLGKLQLFFLGPLAMPMIIFLIFWMMKKSEINAYLDSLAQIFGDQWKNPQQLN